MVYTNLCLADGKCVDIETKDGVIVTIQPSKKQQNSLYIVPKIVDLNVSLKDAQLKSSHIKEIASEARMGGVGYIVLMPNTSPSIDNDVALEYVQNSLKDIHDITIDTTINALQEDLSLSNIAILLKRGALTAYMSTFAKNNIALKVAEYLKMYKKPLFCKAEDNSLKSSGVMFEGDVSSNLGLAGIPELSEVLHVSRMIEIARYYGITILFKAVASPRSLELIAKAKKEGVEVYSEVSLQHLLFSDEACKAFNTTAKIDPPLVEESMRKELLKALEDGTIDTLTLLHAPSSPVNKEVAFFDAHYGNSSLEWALPLYYTKLVKSGVIDFQKLLELTLYNPLKFFNKEVAKIQEGAKVENFVLFDITKSSKISHSNSLYNGEEIYGEVKELS